MLPAFTVAYDAYVLYPAALRSLLMYLAISNMYRARWTDQIHDEWIRNVLKDRPNISATQLTETRRLMLKIAMYWPPPSDATQMWL